MKKPKGLEHIRIPVETTGHIFITGNKNAQSFWLITHGYAMTADQMIRKFDQLDNELHRLCSVEALSHFYHEHDGDQLPVASWMTRRFRLDEIRDYSVYLQSVLEQFSGSAKRILFGFSQGGTTMWRFINQLKPSFDIFINWAGDIPRDSEYDLNYLGNKQLIYVYGDSDKYLGPERIKTLKQLSEELHLDINFIKYKGTHRVDRETLNTISASLKT